MSFPKSPLHGQTFVYNKITYTWSDTAKTWYCEGTSEHDGFDVTLYTYDNVDFNTRRTIKKTDKFQDDYWRTIRKNRDERISEVEWRYNRYYRNERLGLPQVDSITDLDNYVQSLADITDQQNPFEIVWPELNK